MSSVAPPFSAAEFVKTLSDEQKEEVFFELVREALALYPKSGAIPVRPDGERVLAHLLTPAGVETLTAKYGPDCLPEWEIPPGERAGHPRETVTAAELWARIDAAEVERAERLQSRAAG